MSHNTARFFVENRHISWALLIATLLWGTYGYFRMPQRKDPDVPVRVAVAIAPWPGASAEKVEQLVTRKIEEKIAENSKVEKIESISRGSLSVVYVTLHERVAETGKELDDIKLKLDSLRELPAGVGPIEFIKDFGDTAALMLTVASPRASAVEISLRARSVRRAIAQVRAQASPEAARSRATLVVCFPQSINPRIPQRSRDLLARYAAAQGFVYDPRPVDGPGFIGLDARMGHPDAAILAFIRQFAREQLHVSEFHPDVWEPAVIRDPRETEAKLAAVAGDKYSYRELDELTGLIKRTLQTVPQVSKVTRAGVLKERIFLEYSQERMASYGLQPSTLLDILGARNITLPGGVMEVEGKNLTIDPSGEFKSEREIGEVVIATSASGTPVYLRDGVDISRGYESPPRFLNFYTWRDARGRWHRTRAITLAVQMRPGEKIGQFGEAVDVTLAALKQRLPEDLIMARTSDQPLQVRENIHLFMKSLYEAVLLVILVAWVGFWEWRSAVLMATSIPLTLAMTFGMISLLGIDLQQVSIASLIIALGLLVDDPVVAGDAIQRELAAGRRPLMAAWLGPTRLARAILFATLTNIVAYLPLLMLSGDSGRFIYSLPVVLTCSLVASRLVSMTFIPLLGYYLLRPSTRPERPMAVRRQRGFAGLYYRLGGFALEHRWKVLTSVSLVFLGLGLSCVTRIQTQFFPQDFSYLSYVDVWLPEDAPLSATNQAARRAEEVIRQVAAAYGKAHPGEDGRPREVLASITAFIGGGGPRFWFSVSPEQQQLNYAQLLLQVRDKHDTHPLVAPLQRALSAGVPGARVDVRQLESGKPVGIPVSIRISGQEIRPLRELARQVQAIFRAVPGADRIRDDWGAESFGVKLQVDPDRANLAGVSNLDVALSSAAGMSGYPVTTLREDDEQIPVIIRLRMEERAQLADLQNLYVYSLQGPQKVPLRQVSAIAYRMETEKLRRRNQFRTITVSCFPVPGRLPSEVLQAARPQLTRLAQSLPPGYTMEIGGEEEEQVKGFKELAIVTLVSGACIYLALVIQFKNLFKPLIVFAAIPYGLVGALAALALLGSPFGFIAFLGIASLIGVIVSHVIMLFDFIEERHEQSLPRTRSGGAPLREALLDAGIIRLRPVLITVGATVFGLIPLALHGGPLWEPLCYAQIGGLTLATFITLLLVPVLYAIFVLDLKIVTWETTKEEHGYAEERQGL
ncbi:MAG: efflux RND transporter permease subunit [Candidatus Tectomicrobia bacterium]|uniref:Efflux RND transporter permease subunit n=1 Tax=Tectimicrobiota bacterium TaxID=2528274 RepID=A0A932FZD7_UNCTE|nr:efflux RND transporter permease subunit [Candidatus Tectomicrobia bacterium]